MWKLRFTTRTFVVILGILFLISFVFTPTPAPTKSRIHRYYRPPAQSSDALNFDTTDDVEVELKEDFKNILVWSGNTPFQLIQPEEESFVIEDCVDSNCYVTRNKNYLPDLSKFDAIVFGAETMKTNQSLPKIRSQKQKYIFTSLNPASILPITDPVYDNFFNWTWTYRLSSDIPWRLFSIIEHDSDFRVLGPALDMKWPQNLGPIPEGLLRVLKGKTKAVAWFASQCITSSRREEFVQNLTVELNAYGLHVDIYGKCGKLNCDITSADCLHDLESQYYFYFSFEKFIDEDYVTRDILIPLQTAMLPVVYGGANYSRFLPPNSYLNARELGPKKLAEIMNEMINKNSSLYFDYFKWTSRFRYEEIEPDLCSFCAAINEEDMVKNVTNYNNFRRWWKGDVVPEIPDFQLRLLPYNFSLKYSVIFYDVQSDENYYNATDSYTIPSDSINYSNIEFTTNTASETD